MNLATAIFAYLGFQALQKGRAVDAGVKLMYDFEGVQNFSIANWKLNFNALIKFFNPTSKRIDINFIYLKIFLDGKQIGLVKQLNQKLSIQPRQETVITLPVSVSVFSLATSGISWLANYISTKQFPDKVTISIKGYVRAENTTIPIDTSYEYHFDNIQA